jgi:GTP-dependent phosphoenolpyruvate carboxykinase
MSQVYCYPMYYRVPCFDGRRVVEFYHHFAYMNPYRQYQEVDVTQFEQSAKSMQILMREASLVLNKLADSKTFATQVMSAAQQSNMTEVDKLIKSTGIKSKVKTSFNPDGINMKLSSTTGQTECCHLTITLRWQ